MDKKKAIEIIVNCSKEYNSNLSNKNLLIISKDNITGKYSSIETVFEASNFMHLTGIIKNKVSANSFFKKCLKGQLSPNDFDFKKDGTTAMKLNILPNILEMSSEVKMVGDFYNTGINLYAEKIAGNTIVCMGFKEVNGFHIPISILKEDIRKITLSQEQVVAILWKLKKEKSYTNIRYINKKTVFEFNNLPTEISDKIQL